MAHYKYSKYFYQVFEDRTGLKANEDNLAYILGICNTTEPHKKIDNKGRPSAYFYAVIEDIPLCIVCDYQKEMIITLVKETHHHNHGGKNEN
jgi:hypothetical protein